MIPAGRLLTIHAFQVNAIEFDGVEFGDASAAGALHVRLLERFQVAADHVDARQFRVGALITVMHFSHELRLGRRVHGQDVALAFATTINV